MSEEDTAIVKADSSSGLAKVVNGIGSVTKFVADNKETIDKTLDVTNKALDAAGQGFGELERGTGDAIGAIGRGTGNAIGAVGQAVKIAAATPAMIAKFRADQKKLETIATTRLAELAEKYKTWAHAFDTDADQRGQSLDMVEKTLDRAIAEGDRETILKSLDALIGTLEKTDLTKHSSILTEEWKGTTLPGADAAPQPNLLEDNGDYDPGF